jgi:hypothetical protein
MVGIAVGSGYMYSHDLNTRPVWYSDARFVSGCRMVLFSNGLIIIKAGYICQIFEWSKRIFVL